MNDHDPAATGAPDGTGYGIRVESGAWFVNLMLENLVGEVKIINGRAAMPDEGRPLVLLAAHGSVLGPLPAMAALCRMYVKQGLGKEVAGFYHHRSLLYVPGVKAVLQKMGALSAVYDLGKFVQMLKSGRIRIAGNALEGANCFFSWDEFVGPFRTGGMIAAAILADAPICLLAHHGTEPWSVRLDLPFGLTVPETGGLRGINLPIGPIKKIERLDVYCRRYKPAITKRKFEKLDHAGRRVVLAKEMGTIRERLNLMMKGLAEGVAGP